METKMNAPRGRERGNYAAEKAAYTAKKTDYYSVRYWLRPSESVVVTAETPRSILVGIRINCQHTVVLPLVELTSGKYERIVVATGEWDQDGQRAKDNPKAGDAIQAYKSRARELYNRQLQHCKNLRIPLKPNSFSVSYEIKYGLRPVVINGEWIYAKHERPLWDSKKGRPFAPVPEYPTEPLSEISTLSVAFTQYITTLRERSGALALSPITLGRWERCLLLLDTFTMHSGQPCPLATKVTVGWARRFHAWLQGDAIREYKLRPLELLQANRLLYKVREVLQWVYEEGLADKNPLLGVKWARAIRRYNILFLEVDQVRQLAQLDLDGPIVAARWWFLLMCYTGMDYPDAVAYAKDRKAYERLGRAGWKIVGNRKKPPHNTYYVPLLPEVLALFEQYPEGPHEYCLNSINLYTAKFEQLLGIDWRITAKTARKTFGNMMLQRGYRIADVSRMLGHSTIAMTERHYVRVSETHIDSAMLRVEGAPSAAQAIVYLEAA